MIDMQLIKSARIWCFINLFYENSLGQTHIKFKQTDEFVEFNFVLSHHRPYDIHELVETLLGDISERLPFPTGLPCMDRITFVSIYVLFLDNMIIELFSSYYDE